MSDKPARRQRFVVGLVTSVAALAAFSTTPAAAAPAEGQVRYANSDRAIAGSYIVVLKDGSVLNPSSAATLTHRYGGRVERVYGKALHAYTAELSDREARRLAADPAVSYVEQDQTLRAEGTQANAPWGLDRVDQRARPLDSSYTYGSSGGVHAYVIDTGVRITHSEFEGRASYGYDFVDGDNVAQDGAGHGTFVAGVIAGKTYGVAKNASIVGVRVLGDDGSGSTSGVIAGVNWVTNNAIKPAVANLSLGGGVSSSLDAAVRNSIASGVTYAIAAGNSGANAANYSPARVTQGLTVGATGNTDARASWSNYGSVVDLFAPGANITSAWNTSDSSTYTGSGTSFAAPHVAGGAALYLAAHPSATPETVNSAIVSAATTGVVTGGGSGSPNRLLYTSTLGT